MVATYFKKTDFLLNEREYLKAPREKTLFRSVAVLYLIAYYILPPYFGIPTPGFDLTALRIMILIAGIMMICDYDRLKNFIEMVKTEKTTYLILPYIFVIFYTMVFRFDFNAFLNPFFEILEMYLLIYMIREALGVNETVRLVIVFIWILAILGIVEAITQYSPFVYLMTIDGLATGRFIRAGSYRIMSNCVHALGYGLLLVTAIPFSGYDIEKKEFNIFRRPILLFVLMANVFLNGSRSTLGLALVEVAAMFVLSDRKYFRENLVYITTFLVLLTGFLLVGRGTPPGKYMMLQITSVIDSVFGTRYSVKYGANLDLLNGSSAYRDQLKGVFGVKWLNPILGRGRKRAFRAMVNGAKIESIDNFYIADYIRYAYPGMFSIIYFFVRTIYNMLKDLFKTRSALLRVILISTVTYCAELYVVDSLMTLKYLYLNVALFICMEKVAYVPESDSCRYIGKKDSKYVKK